MYSAYNVVIERPLLMSLHAAMSIWHLIMKFPTSAGQGCVQGNKKEARECYNASIVKAKKGLCVSNMVICCNGGEMNTINMEVDNREGKMLKPNAPPNKEKSL